MFCIFKKKRKKNKKMKLSIEEKKTFEWLGSYGFTNYDINYLIKLYNKESIPFKIKSFNKNDFPELKKYLKKQEHSNYIDYILQDVKGVDKERVKNILYNS